MLMIVNLVVKWRAVHGDVKTSQFLTLCLIHNIFKINAITRAWYWQEVYNTICITIHGSRYDYAVMMHIAVFKIVH